MLAQCHCAKHCCAIYRGVDYHIPVLLQARALLSCAGSGRTSKVAPDPKRRSRRVGNDLHSPRPHGWPDYQCTPKVGTREHRTYLFSVGMAAGKRPPGWPRRGLGRWRVQTRLWVPPVPARRQVIAAAKPGSSSLDGDFATHRLRFGPRVPRQVWRGRRERLRRGKRGKCSHGRAQEDEAIQRPIRVIAGCNKVDRL